MKRRERLLAKKVERHFMSVRSAPPEQLALDKTAMENSLQNKIIWKDKYRRTTQKVENIDLHDLKPAYPRNERIRTERSKRPT